MQLIDAAEDNQLWAQSWERGLGDIFAVQQEIADSVRAALKVQLLIDQDRSPQPTNPQAYTLFLQARHTGQLGNMERLKNAETLLRESLALDSLYAPAWAYLAVILNRQSNIGMRSAVEGQEMAREAAFIALSIDSTSATAWST